MISISIKEGPAVVYGLVDPRSGAIRYIGSTTKPDKRLRDHLRNPTNDGLGAWFEDLLSDGLRPMMIYIQWHESQGKAGWAEARLISAYSLVHHEQLLNRSDRADFVAYGEVVAKAKRTRRHQANHRRWVVRRVFDAYRSQFINERRSGSIAFNGRRLSVAKWAELLGITRQRLDQRLRKMPVSVALSYGKGGTSPAHQRYIESQKSNGPCRVTQ